MASRRQAGERRGEARAAVRDPRRTDSPRRNAAAAAAQPAVNHTTSPAQLALVAAPLLAALLVYLPALHNGFIWDDPLILEQLRAIGSIGDLLRPPPIIPHFYFRPLIFATYLFDRFLGGETPFWFHASVVAFHVLNTLLVFLLARRLFPNSLSIAAGGALLFAVVPTHVESVAWMAGRSDVVVCTFILLTMLLCTWRRPWSPWLGGATFLLALLSKEMAIASLIAVPALDFLSSRRLEWTRYLPLVLATGIYFALRQRALGAFVGGVPSPSSPGQLVADVLRALGFYAVQTVAPLRLCAYIPDVPSAAGYVVAGLALLLLGVGLAVFGWWHNWQTAFLTLWFFAMLSPSLTVIIRRSASAVVADRYLYVPSVGACVLLAWALVRLGDRLHLTRGWVLAAIAALSAACAAQVLSYGRVWTDDLSFWSDVAAKVPDYTLPHRELASALLVRGRLPEAEHELQQGLLGKSGPEDRAMTYNNLGNLYRRLKRYDEAQGAFDAALKIAPHPTLYHNLGMTLMAQVELESKQGDQAAVQRDIVRARDAFERALSLGSAPGATQTFLAWDGAKTHALLGQVLYSMGDHAGAREHLETSLRLQPTGPTADVTRRFLQQMAP